MWPLFALISALMETSKDVIGKTGSQRTNEYVTAFSMQFFSSLILFAITLFRGIPVIHSGFWVYVLCFCITIPCANILYMRAIKLSPLSVSVPMLAFNPIITAFLAVIFDRRFPDVFGWVGIVLVCIGLYCLRLERQTLHKGIFFPLLRIRDEPGAIAMLGVSCIWAVGAHLSAAAVRLSNPLFAAWMGTVVGAFVLFFIARRHGNLSVSTMRAHAPHLITLGFTNAFSDLAMYTALTTGFTPYVVSIKRTSILWSSLMGKFLYHESVGKIKLFGLAVMLLGVFFILV